MSFLSRPGCARGCGIRQARLPVAVVTTLLNVTTETGPVKKLLAFLSLLAISPAYGADIPDRPDILDRDKIIVSATRAPTPVNQVGASVSVIDAADISARQYQFAADAIADTVGAAIARNGAFGGLTSLRIRGEASGRTLVLIDGVVVNDPSAPGGGFNFASLDVADIEKIEVLRGPQSILYGSEAIGGVVNIITKRGNGAPQLTLFAEGGSFKTYRGGAGLSGGGARGDYRISAFGIKTDGISKADESDGNGEADAFDSYSLSGNFGLNVEDNFRLESFLRFGRSNTEFDGFPPPDFSLADSADRDETEEVAAAGRALITVFDGKLENIVSVGYSAIKRNNFSGDTPTFFAEGTRVSFEYLGRFQLAPWLSGVAGAETETADIDTGDINDDVTTNSVFGLLQLTPVKRLTLTGGVRHDDHETFGGATTGRVTAALAIDEAGVILRSSWGGGFAAPTLFQLNFVCCGGAQPNRNLIAERSNGWDVSAEKTFLDGAATARVTYFRQATDNLIDFEFTSGAFINIDQTLRKGVEAEVDWRLSDTISFGGAYAYIDAVELPSGDALLRQPRHAASVHASWRPAAPLNLSASVRYNGEERDSFGATGSFVRADIRASYAVSDTLELFGRIENLLDEQYQDVLGFGAPGLSAFAGIRVRL